MYEERYDTLMGRVKSLIDFTQDIDAEVANLEQRLQKVKKQAKSRSKGAKTKKK
jgi:prefoldin subunit 5